MAAEELERHMWSVTDESVEVDDSKLRRLGRRGPLGTA